MGIAGIFAILLLIGVYLITNHFLLPEDGASLAYLSEVRLSVVVILGTLSMLATLTLVSVIFSALDLGDQKRALGLPEGSIRAIIALSLIIIFVIVGIYMFQRIDTQVEKLDADTLFWDGREFINVTKTAYVPIPPDESYVDFAQDMMTTIGTLVVALAGFYFGTRAVEVAKGGIKRNLRIVNPSDNEITWKTDDTELELFVESTPEDEAIDWNPLDETDGKLMQIARKKFLYTRGPTPKEKVTLKFKLARYPDVTAKLVIKK